MQRIPLRLLRLTMLFALGLSACNLPTGVPPPSPPEPERFYLTVEALTLTAQAAVISTPEATATASPTPPPSETPTPEKTMVSVSVDTNCRTGPGKIYDYVGALLVGETTEVIARDPTGQYWYVQNPDQPGGFCWLWGQYATVSGNTSALPIYTPPPSPTPAPDFEILSAGIDSCVGWYVEVRIRNTGTVTFESVTVTAKDLDTDTSVGGATYNEFEQWNGCLLADSKPQLEAGQAGWVNSYDFMYDPSGNEIKATVTACTGLNLTGTCVTKNIKFTP